MRNLFIAVALLLALAVAVQAQDQSTINTRPVNTVMIAGRAEAPYKMITAGKMGIAVFFTVYVYSGQQRLSPLFCVAYNEQARLLLDQDAKIIHVYITGYLQWRSYRYFTAASATRGIVIRITCLEIIPGPRAYPAIH